MNGYTLALIDDNPSDRILFKQMFVGGDKPWLRDVKIEEYSRPLAHVNDYGRFDGVILDNHLMAAVSGVELARQIHEFDWHIPIMLLTGDPYTVPATARNYVDWVSDKILRPVAMDNPYDPLMNLRVMMRNIARADRR